MKKTYSPLETLASCCKHKPTITPETYIITFCETCANQYSKKYPKCKTVLFLTELAQSNDSPFPDYKGVKMSIQDTYSARSKPAYLNAIRKLVERINITLIKPERSGARGKCCR